MAEQKFKAKRRVIKSDWTGEKYDIGPVKEEQKFKATKLGKDILRVGWPPSIECPEMELLHVIDSAGSMTQMDISLLESTMSPPEVQKCLRTLRRDKLVEGVKKEGSGFGPGSGTHYPSGPRGRGTTYDS